MNPNYLTQYNLSTFINAIRNFLLKGGFFEHHLYSTTNYRIENTDTFKIKDNLYLRYNPEPDIWQVGIKHNNFFWIGSMFRNEGKLSDLHQYEFTVVDIYQSNGKMNNVVQKFIELLKNLEKELNLRNLSDLEIKYMTHEEFVEIDKKKVNTKHWLIVIDYPAEESFYDTKEKDSDTTSKFEIFFAGKNGYVEVAACGNLGQNLNDKNFIPDKPDLLNKELLDKKFIGFGIGLERLIFLYDMK